MAGNYFHDPRPFYGLNRHDLVSMEELFYGKRDPWYMHQAPYSHYEDHQRSRSVDPRRPEQYVQSYDQYREYRRPDFRDDTYTNFQHNQMQQQQGKKGGGSNNNSHGGNNNHGGGGGGGGNHNNHGGGNNNNHGGGNNNNHQKKQQKRDSDDEYDDFSSKNKNHNKGSHDNKHSNKGWSDNRGFHGGHKHHHRRSLSLTQTVLKKLGLRDDSSSDSSDDERYGSRKASKGHGGGGHGHGHGKSDHKPYTVRFDDQSYGHHGGNQKHKGVHGLGEDHDSHGSHGKKGGNNHGGNNNHGGQLQGILKKPKNHNNNDDGYSSDEENRGHKKKGGNSESGKKGGGKQLGRSQSLDFRVNLCCDNCERKVKKSLKYMDDVDEVVCDQWNNRVVVVGNAKPESVLKKLRKVKPDTHLCQHHK